jgi:hypothetical protein
MIRSEEDISLARYGTSNVGAMKTVYRRGLGYRYGRYAGDFGVHFNFSLPRFWPVYAGVERCRQGGTAFRSDAYLAGAQRSPARLAPVLSLRRLAGRVQVLSARRSAWRNFTAALLRPTPRRCA